MIDTEKSLKRFTILIFGLIPLIMGLPGCKHDTPPPDDPEPFVRLLTNQSFQSRILNRSMTFAVLLPKEYENSTESFPVVYLLHGLGDDETGWYKWGLINYYVDLNAAETVPMIYVMPKGFNTYWVNKYNGNYPYMDMLVNEMVPKIDSLFRTFRDPQHRAVMGYSMGGYGAMILPAKNPGVFKTGIALSMSFRTDQQYIDEPQGVFDSQWGSVFGGIGTTGTSRLTDYYKTYSPFYFFGNPGDLSLNGQNYFFDCGDDEESLSVPNNALHNLLRDLNIRHEYRTRNGGHSWDYWRKSLPEALKFISLAVQNVPYPDDPELIDPGPAIPAWRIVDKQLDGSNIAFSVALPAAYLSDTSRYPVILVLHDRKAVSQDEESRKMLSILNTNMTGGKIPASLIVEIPLQTEPVSAVVLQQILNQVQTGYRTLSDRKHTILLGNNLAGRLVYDLLPDCAEFINACLLFDANLPQDATAISSDVNYYLDICDEGVNYNSYHSLFMSLRENGIAHEYRVRQGTASHDSFLAGLNESASYMKIHLQN
ncbi:MAG: hypothetical protein D4R64_05130 [Porphyromonadaceae bacterium]|nr:MAG: hypothetical protein D4R64_05130 [Porphyromonadaceae bacterium]